MATGSRQTTDLIENALSKAVLRISKNESNVNLAKSHNITLSMSRRGNCYDNAVAESFFKTIKRELVRKEVFKRRKEASSKIFKYIEMFYNSKRRHSYVGSISPNEFEKRYHEMISK